LHSLIGGAGFREIEVQTESRSIEFASFDAYFSGIEKGATLSGQEFVQLSPSLQRRVRKEVWEELGAPDKHQRLVIDMEVLIGSGRRQLASGDFKEPKASSRHELTFGQNWLGWN
jgi:hypothetical protein